MMDQFRPPTDNLYKFVALSGLAILLATLYLLGTQLGNLYNEVGTLAREVIVEKSHLRQIERREKKVAQLLADNQKLFDCISDTARIDAVETRLHYCAHLLGINVDDAQRQINHTIDVAAEKNDLADELKMNVEIMQSKVDSLRVKFVWFWGSLFGAIILLVAAEEMMRYGFRSWYEKTQKYQDKLLHLSVDDAEKKQSTDDQKDDS